MPALTELGMVPGASTARVSSTTNFEVSVKGTDFVEESTPEHIEAKVRSLSEIDALVPPAVIIVSNSSGFLASHLSSRARHPERILAGHPFNPPFLSPLVEIAGGDAARRRRTKRPHFTNRQ